MKIFKIETRKGWYSACEKIGNFLFPMSCTASFKGATEIFTRARAEKIIKKHNLGVYPYYAHIEEFEWEPEKG